MIICILVLPWRRVGVDCIRMYIVEPAYNDQTKTPFRDLVSRNLT